MLQSESRPAQSLAAFHFAMEASVKNEQKNLKVCSFLVRFLSVHRASPILPVIA